MRFRILSESMISVCLPVFNGEKFLREQVLGILSQLSQTDELILSDDCSSDGSLAVLNEINDPRISVLTNLQRLGPVGNLERALKLSKGDFIFLSDQDDLWMPNKISSCLSALGACDLIMHDAYIIDEAGHQILPSFFAKRGVARGFWRNLLRNSYTGCCMAFRRPVLEAALPFPSNIPMHDQWIGLVAERSFRVAFLAEPLIGYRQHGRNATHTVHGSSNSIWTRLNWRISLLRALCSHH